MEIDKLKHWNRTERTEEETHYEFTKQVKGYIVTAHIRKVEFRSRERPLWSAEIFLLDDYGVVEEWPNGLYKSRERATKRLSENVEIFEEPEDFKGYFDTFRDE